MESTPSFSNWNELYSEVILRNEELDTKVTEFADIISRRGEQGVFKFCGTDIMGTKHFASVGI
jgi:hypothetical protein